MKLGILGAGGFVGTALCERLFFDKEHDFVPIIHSYSGAARLARLPLTLKAADVLDEAQMRAATAGCDVLINCSRGDGVVMDLGLRNIIKSAQANAITRIVHISSIAIYGSNPPPAAEHETAPTSPDDPYGVWKADQDELLIKAGKSGLGVIMLCPANIYGPYSPFIVGAAQHLLKGAVALVDGGTNPTNNVHVNNIVEAILAAVRSDIGWGERYFVNEPERVTWRQFYEDMNAALGITRALECVASRELPVMVEEPSHRLGVKDNVKILASGDFRRALGVIPAFAKLNGQMYKQFSRLDPRFQKWAREKMSRPQVVPKQAPHQPLDNRFVLQQAKSVYHSPEKIMKSLAFRPFSYRAGMDTVRDWLQFAFR